MYMNAKSPQHPPSLLPDCKWGPSVRLLLPPPYTYPSPHFLSTSLLGIALTSSGCFSHCPRAQEESSDLRPFFPFLLCPKLTHPLGTNKQPGPTMMPYMTSLSLWALLCYSFWGTHCPYHACKSNKNVFIPFNHCGSLWRADLRPWMTPPCPSTQPVLYNLGSSWIPQKAKPQPHKHTCQHVIISDICGMSSTF